MTPLLSDTFVIKSLMRMKEHCANPVTGAAIVDLIEAITDDADEMVLEADLWEWASKEHEARAKAESAGAYGVLTVEVAR